jgi:hypothetical protein
MGRSKRNATMKNLYLEPTIERKRCLSRFKWIWLLLALYLFSFPVDAATQRDVQTWFNLTAMGNFHKQDKTVTKIKYWLEGQQRLGGESSHFTQSLLRTALGYSLTKDLSLWVGYAWVLTSYPLTEHSFKEDRIWEQLLWIKSKPSITLTSRTRMEQRFLENAHKKAYRARQLLKISLPLKKYPKFSLVTSDEVFVHKNNFIGRNSHGFDQNRFFVGLGYQFKPGFTAEIGYMNQYIRRFGVPNFLANIASINFILFL